MKLTSTKKKFVKIANNNITDETVIVRTGSLKDKIIREASLQKQPTNIVKTIQTHTFEKLQLTAPRPYTYDFTETFVGPSNPRIIPTQTGWDYTEQYAMYTIELKNVPFDLAYSIKDAKLITFASLQEYIDGNPGRVFTAEKVYDLPEIAITVISTKPLIEIEVIENSSNVNLTVHGHFVIDNDQLYNGITDITDFDLQDAKFLNFHSANINVYVGRSLFYI